MTIDDAFVSVKHLISIHMPHTWHDLRRTTVDGSPCVFQSTCHIRGMTHLSNCHRNKKILFQSTCHIRGMTDCIESVKLVVKISIHMPHTWHDQVGNCPLHRECTFQSTCHIRGMTLCACTSAVHNLISIHMPHTWHDVVKLTLRRGLFISIHMPHTWHDTA